MKDEEKQALIDEYEQKIKSIQEGFDEKIKKMQDKFAIEKKTALDEQSERNSKLIRDILANGKIEEKPDKEEEKSFIEQLYEKTKKLKEK